MTLVRSIAFVFLFNFFNLYNLNATQMLNSRYKGDLIHWMSQNIFRLNQTYCICKVKKKVSWPFNNVHSTFTASCTVCTRQRCSSNMKHPHNITKSSVSNTYRSCINNLGQVFPLVYWRQHLQYITSRSTYSFIYSFIHSCPRPIVIWFTLIPYMQHGKGIYSLS